MAETIDEAAIIAWVDGELDETQTAQVLQALANDPDLAGLAERHRRMKSRFAAAFGPIAGEPVAPPARVVSLAAIRAQRETKVASSPQRRWGIGGSIAASLLLGVLVGHGMNHQPGVTDSLDTLALSAPMARALDGQLSGDGGVVRVALSFRGQDGHYCRSFSGRNLSGVACRDGSGWQLRYASPTSPQNTDYRMAGSDNAEMRFIQSAMAGEPLDHEEEMKARANHWE